MRLDRFFSDLGLLSRSESKNAIRHGRVRVNGTVATKENQNVDEREDTVTLDGVPVLYKRFVYYVVNKPQGYVSATEDGKDKYVTLLLPEGVQKRGVFPCGRLDKNTTGLLFITDDGDLCHRLLSPKYHVTKTYAFSVKFPLSEADVKALEGGVDIGGYVTKPCTVTLDGERTGTISICEGKFHQIKLMMEAVHNQITALKRIAFGNLTLDDALNEGAYRELTEDEINALQNLAQG